MYVLDVFQATVGNLEERVFELEEEFKVRRKLGKQQNFTEPRQSCILNRTKSTAAQT